MKLKKILVNFSLDGFCRIQDSESPRKQVAAFSNLGIPLEIMLNIGGVYYE